MGGRILVVGAAEAREALRARLREAGHEIIDDGGELADLAVILGPPAAVPGVHTLALLPAGDDLASRLEEAFVAGVDAALPLSSSDQVLQSQITRQLDVVLARRRAASAPRGADSLVDIERLIATGASVRDILRPAAAALEVETALVVFDQEPFWIADDRDDVPARPETLDGHPEARAAIATGEIVVEPQAVAFPMEWRDGVVGALVVRGPALALDEQQVRFGRVLAGLLAPLAAGVARPIAPEQSERTGRVVARRSAERRLRAIEKFRAYFEAAADSVMVLDGEGRILFLNHAAEALIGFARAGLVGKPLADIVLAGARAALAPVISGVVGGKNFEPFDLPVSTTSGDHLWVSVSTSTMLAEHGAVILSFRDVTSERRLEAELRKTKEFLEKLIDSTVDAIIAADLTGTVILYNPGAERVFGWPAEEVIGRMSVERLYPEGVARQIMRMLRSPSYGGIGRLELTRREVLTRGGDIVPVNMTASTIYEDGREVATVGILSDLRERIRIEQRLLMAQEKLLITEKQAVIAELAGAAAHELNQPLTSVTLYVEMMQRRMPPDDVNQRAVQAIARESERMAEIVKKIGRITRYETKQYVGGASILDLEKSSESGGVSGE